MHLIFRFKFTKLLSRASILLLLYICIINQSLANTIVNSESEYFESLLIENATNLDEEIILNIEDKKKEEFNVWLDDKSKIILRVSYSKFGDWEYIVKNIEKLN